VFTAIHLGALAADSYTDFGWTELFVPMASRWRPGPVAWGIVALYLAVAVQLSSWTMRWIPRRLWHTIHLSSFGLFVAATVHGAAAGADRANLLVQWLALSGVLLVLFLVLFRLLAPRRARSAARVPGRRATPGAAGS
jgi:hypothetical protein